MTPKEKAKELVERFKSKCWIWDDTKEGEKIYYLRSDDAKQCALICVEIEHKAKLNMLIMVHLKYSDEELGKMTIKVNKEFREVKQEINKL